MAGKKFRFSLEQVLAVRRRAVEHATAELMRAVQAREEQEAALARRRSELEALSGTAPAGGGLDPQAFRRFDAYRREAREACVSAEKLLELLRRDEERARRLLQEARTAEEALQTLYDQEKATHEAAAASAETAFMDEQALNVFNRARRADR